MLRTHKRTLILTSLITLLPILVGLLLWDQLPEAFATHWGFDGQPDGWSSLSFAVFAPPLFLLATHWLCIFITAKDPKNQNRNQKPFGMVLWIIPILSNLCSGIMFALAMGMEFSINLVMQIAMGAMFLIIGNYLPKCRMNSTIGIKVPWTYSSEENWNATHRLGGKMWVIGGLLIMLCAFLPSSWGIAIMIIALAVMAVVPVVYSYVFYKKEKNQGKAMMSMLSQTDRKIMKWTLIFVAVLLIGIAFLLFSGTVEVEYGDTAFTVDATFYSPLTVKYESIESIEYRDGNMDGTRVGGIGSFRLLLGFFENEEFGTYTRYTYTNPGACIVIRSGDKVLVLSGDDAAQTQAIYQQLLVHTGK